MTSDQLFKTSNFSLTAAILATRKAKLVSSERISPYRFEFHLSPANVCLELEKQYLNDDLRVSVRSVEDNIKMLKSITREDSYER